MCYGFPIMKIFIMNDLIEELQFLEHLAAEIMSCT